MRKSKFTEDQIALALKQNELGISVAAAMAAGCRTLLSEDLQHGQTLASLTVIDPFR